MATRTPVYRNAAHRAAAYVRTRRADLSRDKTMYGNDWRRLRDAKIAMTPLCETCEANGRVTEAAHVHHVIPIRIEPDRRLDIDNLMSVCVPCHAELDAAIRRANRL